LPLPRAESTPTIADELPVGNATLHESLPQASVASKEPAAHSDGVTEQVESIASTSLPPPVPTNELPLPRTESTPDELSVANATLHESLPQASVASKEPAAHSDGVTEQVESTASSVTSDAPIDVSTSDFSPPPLEFGDFSALGLTGWGLGGIAVWPFEWIQVSTGLPWFYTIIAGTMFWRLLMVPLALRDIRDGEKLRNSDFSKKIRGIESRPGVGGSCFTASCGDSISAGQSEGWREFLQNNC
jgi:hypothetical protein